MNNNPSMKALDSILSEEIGEEEEPALPEEEPEELDPDSPMAILERLQADLDELRARI